MNTTKRIGAVDLLRGLASLGIVWFHAGAPAEKIALSGLTVFFVLLFLMHPGPEQPLATTVRRRADRLIRPWLVWSAIFGVAKVAQSLVTHHPLSDEFEIWLLLTGPGLHLWFLPFAFCCLVLLSTIERVQSLRTPAAFAALVALCLFAVPLSATLAQTDSTLPTAEWGAALAPVLVGVALRAAGGSLARQGLVLAVTLMSCALTYALQGEVIVTVPLGLSLTLIALHAPGASNATSRCIGSTAMPIYLIHPIFLSLLGTTSLAASPIILALLAAGLAAATGEVICRAGWAPKLL